MVNQMAPHVDFKHVRQHASFEAVAAAYNIDLIKDGPQDGQFKALCPFHDDTKPSLKINTTKKNFHCFACEAGGNILDFVRDMEGLGKSELRPAAMKLAEICGISTSDKASTKPARKPIKRKAKPPAPADAEPTSPLPTPPTAETPSDEELDGVPYNRVLTFTLQTELDDELKLWLEGRGIDHHRQQEFGLGRASKRSKTIGDRLAIPIHNADGELVAYCGRYVGDSTPDDEPKYKLPPGFRKDLEIFNLHRAKEQPGSWLFIFESYFSVMRHHFGRPCISFNGRTASPEQIELVGEHFGDRRQVVIVADGDEPGRDGARTIAGQLADSFWVHLCDLPDGVKPHHLTNDELRLAIQACLE